MKTKSILIVTYDWMPRNSIAVHRPYAWAKYWSLAGLKITVLTAKKYAYDEPLDLELPVLDAVKVIEIPYRSEGSLNKNTSNIKRNIINFLKKYSSTIKKISGINFDIRDAWAKKAMPIALDLCNSECVDIVVSTYGPRACHYIAAKIKKEMPHIKWVADYRDMWSIRHNTETPLIQKRSEKKLEKKLLSKADLITTVSEPLVVDLGEFLKKKVYPVFNGYDAEWSDAVKRFNKINEDKKNKSPIKIIYTGIIYPGLRDPSPLFEAVNNLIENKVISKDEIHIHFYGHRQIGISELIYKNSASEYVTVHGHVSRELVLKEQQNADLLLLLESGENAAKGVLTGKIFEYMISGKPVLSLGSKKDSAIGLMIEKTGIGVVCENDTKEIKLILTQVLNNKLSAIYHPKIDSIKKFDRRVQAMDFLNLINDVM